MRGAGFALILGLLASGCAHAPQTGGAQTDGQDFVGQYDGSSFEVAAGLRIGQDGNWDFGASFGAVDLRSKGTWRVEGQRIVLTTNPKPVAPEFRYLGLAPSTGNRLVGLVDSNGEPFVFVDVWVRCADGSTAFQQIVEDETVYEERAPDTCAKPVWVKVRQSNYDVDSARYDLAEIGWTEGQMLRFEFIPNDLGVLDMTGVSAVMKGADTLVLDGPLGKSNFRRLSTANRNED